jgi:selenocysteine lyase/cysteine desulfurase
MNVPIIRLEVEGMKYTVQTALLAHASQVSDGIQQAVEAYCTEANITAIVEAEARRQIEEALKQSVKDFFNFSGPGRAAVREAVMEHLNAIYPPVRRDE